MKKLFILPVLVLSLLLLNWCDNQKIQTGDKVSLEYDSFLQDGKIIEDSIELTIVVWLWQSFPVFDKELIWMKEWSSKTIMANAEDAYGIYFDQSKVQDITTTVFSKIWKQPKVWETIELWDMKWLVLETGPITHKIDFNSPETREDVEFKIKVLDILEDE